MKAEKFRIQRHSQTDKSFIITCPKGMEIFIQVDFDDVNHSQVNKEAKEIVRILNNHIGEIQ